MKGFGGSGEDAVIRRLVGGSKSLMLGIGETKHSQAFVRKIKIGGM